jgi:hypothetical protein
LLVFFKHPISGVAMMMAFLLIFFPLFMPPLKKAIRKARGA